MVGFEVGVVLEVDDGWMDWFGFGFGLDWVGLVW